MGGPFYVYLELHLALSDWHRETYSLNRSVVVVAIRERRRQHRQRRARLDAQSVGLIPFLTESYYCNMASAVISNNVLQRR